jgi:hypothetical protein
MHEIKNAQVEKWVVCHNGVDVFHLSNLKVGGNLSSGQPQMEQFDTEEQAVNFIKGIKPDYKQPKKQK